MREVPPYVAVVQDRHEAHRVAGLLTGQYRECVFGADTEVSLEMDIISSSRVLQGTAVFYPQGFRVEFFFKDRGVILAAFFPSAVCKYLSFPQVSINWL